VRGYFGVEIERLSNDLFIYFQTVNLQNKTGRDWMISDFIDSVEVNGSPTTSSKSRKKILPIKM